MNEAAKCESLLRVGRALTFGLLASGALALGACGRAGLYAAPDEASYVATDAASADATVAAPDKTPDAASDAASDDATRDAPPASTDAPLDLPAVSGATDADAGSEDAEVSQDVAPEAPRPDWPIVVSLVNVGTSVLQMPPINDLCGFALSVRRVDELSARMISSIPQSTWCTCDSCVFGPLRCTFEDFICDYTNSLQPGDHLDLSWDGLVAARQMRPPDSGCTGFCDAWEMVTPGRYIFEQGLDVHAPNVEASLPALDGVVEIPLGRR